MTGPYSTKKGNFFFFAKETNLGIKCTYVMFILSLKKT